MSVVVCTLNGAKVIQRAIESLLAQDYPRTHFQIIVVDDGSTDNTAEIVKNYPVIYIKHEKNLGIAAARNTGLKRAAGQIYVSFDDDCFANPDWLRQIAAAYDRPKVAGVASMLDVPTDLHSLAEKYMAATGSGNAPSTDTDARNSPLTRLASYVRNHIRGPQPGRQSIYEVRTINGATASFPMQILKTVNGWDESTSGIEDTDLCQRISREFPEHKFYAASQARMTHDPKLSVGQLLKRQLSRGRANYTYYRKFNLTPPIFPFPIFWLAISILLTFTISLESAALGLLLSPLLLYFWWPIRAITEQKAIFLAFPYLQMGEESASLIGMIRGIETHNTFTSFRPTFVFGVLTAAWAMLELLGPQGLVPNILISLFVLLAPGYLIYKTIIGNHAKSKSWTTVAFSAALSVIALILVGLAINTVLPAFGYHWPLSIRPLVAGIAVMMIILIGLMSHVRPDLRIILPKRSISPRTMLLNTFGCTLPIFAALGATTLNNGGNNHYTLAMFTGIVIYASALLWPQDGRVRSGYSFGIFSIALSLLLATSLRGMYITGHDIMQEYQVFQLTTTHYFWNMDFYHDAYMACLSITIFPTVLAKLTTITDPYIFKIIFQLIFALVPVIIYETITPYVSKRLAFLAAFIFVSFPTFLMDMPMLGRQEIAFLFFALAFMALLNKQLGSRQRTILVTIMLIGTVLSHYSTSYVAIAVILIAKGFEFAYKLSHHIRRHRPASDNWMPLSWPIIGIMILTTYLWNTQLTQTSTSIASTVASAVTSLPQIFERKTISGVGAYSLVGTKLSDEQLFQNYVSSSLSSRDQPESYYYPSTLTDKYPVIRAEETVEPLHRVGRWMQVKGLDVYSLVDWSRQIYAKLLQPLMVIGAFMLLFSRRLFRMPRQYPIMGIAFLAIIVLQVLLPSSVINYGLLRLIQQGLLFLALPVALATMIAPKILKFTENASLRIAAVFFIATFSILSGLIPSLTGGYKPALATSNSGFYYEAYYTHADELAGFEWLKTNAPAGSIVNADEFARRKMITYAGIFARPNMTPDTIVRDGYVFLSNSNTTTGKIPVYVDGALLYQAVPLKFIQDTKTLVYSNGQVKIYR